MKEVDKDFAYGLAIFILLLIPIVGGWLEMIYLFFFNREKYNRNKWLE